MRRMLWMIVALCFVMSGMLFTVSCAKKTISSDAALSQAEEDAQRLAAERARQEELARQRALEEQRLEEERQRAAALQREGMGMTERERFVNEDVHFDFDSSVLSAEAQQILLDKAQWLRKNPGVSVVIEGHCDERGTNEYNMALGERRARAAYEYLVLLGIEAGRLTIISYGEEYPAVPGSNEEAWAKNRRDEFKASVN